MLDKLSYRNVFEYAIFLEYKEADIQVIFFLLFLKGSPICHPHTCICGGMVESDGLHGLSCKNQMGKWSRHNEANNLIQRALAEAKIPARLEPPNLSRTDGKRVDGITTTSWREGKCLIWDFTCADTLCQSYVKHTAKEPGKAAEIRENFKIKI